jgi:predicted DNA-binding transcriptional regulator AlpA
MVTEWSILTVRSKTMFVNLSELLDRRAVCQFFGGTKPLDPATLYRGIQKGRYPKPVKVGPGSSRWLREECEAALQSMISGRAVR